MDNLFTKISYIVGTALILSTMGIIAIALFEHPIPDVLQNISIASLTGLVGLLVQPQKKDGP